MRLLRLLVTLGLLGALAWTGWWYALAYGQAEALRRWFDARARAGWQAETASIDIAGFPGEVRRTLRDIRLADPRAGWSWVVPSLTLSGPPWDPTSAAVALPPAMTVSVLGERVEIAADRLGGALRLWPEPALGLDRLSLRGAGLALVGRSGWTAAFAELGGELVERPPGTAPDHSYDLRLEGSGVRLPAPVLAMLDPTGVLSETLDSLRYDATMTLDRAIDRHLVEEGRAALRAATIREAALVWGEMRLTAQGRIAADAAGYAAGALDLRLRNWRAMLAVAERSGAIGGTTADAIERALSLIGLFGQRDEDLEVGLTLEDGRLWIGPVAIGDAPQIAPPLGG